MPSYMRLYMQSPNVLLLAGCCAPPPNQATSFFFLSFFVLFFFFLFLSCSPIDDESVKCSPREFRTPGEDEEKCRELAPRLCMLELYTHLANTQHPNPNSNRNLSFQNSVYTASNMCIWMNKPQTTNSPRKLEKNLESSQLSIISFRVAITSNNNTTTTTWYPLYNTCEQWTNNKSHSSSTYSMGQGIEQLQHPLHMCSRNEMNLLLFMHMNPVGAIAYRPRILLHLAPNIDRPQDA